LRLPALIAGKPAP